MIPLAKTPVSVDATEAGFGITDLRSADDLELVAVTKRYGTAVAVDRISHLFRAGSYVCLLGPSGCGKSSTLRMIAGHETVTDGAIILGGKDVSKLVSDTIRAWDARTIVEKLETSVGRDLQFIRVNGTVIGGLVGLVLHLGAELMQ